MDLFQEESEKTREKRQKKSREAELSFGSSAEGRQREKKEKAPQKELSKEALCLVSKRFSMRLFECSF